jgi:hypothetical protein
MADTGAMMTRLALCATLLLTTAACSSASPADEAEAHPSWLVGSWSVSSSSSSVVSYQHYSFGADGTGSWNAATVYAYSSLSDSDNREIIWRFQAPSTLVIDGTPHPIDVSDGCTQLTMDGLTWDGLPRDGTCPTSTAPLTETEKSFVGSWTVDRPPQGDLFQQTARGSLTLTEDRQLHLNLYITYRSTWETLSIDKSGQPWLATDEGGLSAPTNDSDGHLELKLTRKGNTLEICYGAVGCYVGHK